MFNDITYIAMVVLVPLIPAVILYKFLPSGRTEVGGPFKGLDIKLSGAFAGYFLVVLIVTSLLVFLIKQKPSPCPACPTPPLYQVYTVTGKVDLASGPGSERIDTSHLTFSIEPPDRALKPDGSFSLKVPVRPGQSGELEFPELVVGHQDANYLPATIFLDEKSPYSKESGFTVEYNKATKTIVVKPAIHLTYESRDGFDPKVRATPEP